MELKFVCDVHLGKLAKALRMLGFDTVYQNNFTNTDLERIAVEENRILLSRNTAFSKNKNLRLFIITSENPSIQIKAVIEHFELKNKIDPFTLCIVCNEPLQKVSKEDIISQIPANTKKYFEEFRQCANCQRIYWKGSHYERMLKEISFIL